ncbi:THUMP domain-containing protein 1 homolog [Belonocnema kinseyi]|uniref:THUMP domain-containing protein 1 homolog n=1 Tax=Belonocnema kinseyi TaxID=2817044 RepID=UPI00143DA760|nr:THUMP domain-containing protein 1 homolog [Belonocnema kinseyi]
MDSRGPPGPQSSKRKPNWYSNTQKKRKQFVLEAGMKGFLCTCNFQEKNCIRDAYRLLNEFADKAEGQDSKVDVEVEEVKEAVDPQMEVEVVQVALEVPDDVAVKPLVKDPAPDIEVEELPAEVVDPQVEVIEPQLVVVDPDEDNEDISTALSKEIDQLNAEVETPGDRRKFQAVETGVKNTLFIQTSVPDPLKLALSIIKDVYTTKKQRSKFLLRLVPVEIVTKANLDDLKSKANTVLEKYFSQEPKTFSIIFNRHSNSNMQRNAVIEELGEIITNKNPGNKANLKNPEIAVVVEVIRGFCLLSVAPNYMTYKKYNLLEMCNPTQQQQKDSKDTNDLAAAKNDDVPGVEDDKIIA